MKAETKSSVQITLTEAEAQAVVSELAQMFASTPEPPAGRRCPPHVERLVDLLERGS